MEPIFLPHPTIAGDSPERVSALGFVIFAIMALLCCFG